MEQPHRIENLFPQNIQLEDVRNALQGRDDFREVEYETYYAFVYFLGKLNNSRYSKSPINFSCY